MTLATAQRTQPPLLLASPLLGQMLIIHYPYAVTQLLYHYRKNSDLHNEEKFNEWLRYAEVNATEIDRELLGLPKAKKEPFVNKLFKK